MRFFFGEAEKKSKVEEDAKNVDANIRVTAEQEVRLAHLQKEADLQRAAMANMKKQALPVQKFDKNGVDISGTADVRVRRKLHEREVQVVEKKTATLKVKGLNRGLFAREARFESNAAVRARIKQESTQDQKASFAPAPKLGM